jgi:hypothetical protein
MKEKRSFTIQSLLTVLIVNVILLGIGYYFFVQGNPLPGAMDPTVFYWLVGLVGSAILWLLVWMMGGKAIESAAASASAAAMEQARSQAKPTPAVQAAPKPEPVKKAEFVVAPEASAIQLLSILQRKGRLIDFLQEDLSLFDDAQIGAAVRNIHDSSRQALAEYVELAPIYDQAEGGQVTVKQGFDAYAVRLSGDVAGNPPFTGVLRHRGWRVVSMRLPEQSKEQAESKVVAAAEVEVEG